MSANESNSTGSAHSNNNTDSTNPGATIPGLDLPDAIRHVRSKGNGPGGALPVSESMLLDQPSGNLFGWTQNVGMGWKPEKLLGRQMLILSTQGGVRAPDGSPIALGFHTGHWEIGGLVQAAAETFQSLNCVPFAAYCSDPCDGRTQGTTGMFDSLPYRNDAAQVFRRLARSLPTREGVLGVATCDKGLPAMMMALAGLRDLPGVIVPGGVTLPPSQGEDAGAVQTLGARFAHGLVTLEEAADLGCKACGSPGGGCQFLGTAATSQVVAEALGMAIPHSALSPSGQPVWTHIAHESARALHGLATQGIRMRDILTEAALRNAMVTHAAFGGSTNLLLHIPAIAHAAGIRRPVVEDWIQINREVPRIVSVLPNGPVHHPTVRVFLAGGVPEVMLWLRRMGALDTSALTVTGKTLGENLDAWESSERRAFFRAELQRLDGVDPDSVILPPKAAAAAGMSSTVTFPTGNLAPEGAVVKSGAIDPALLDENGRYLLEGPAKVFSSESEAIQSIKKGGVQAGDVLILAGCGPMGTGMEETYQLTSALKHLPFGKQVALLTDARFSGVSTGACVGHIGPEALAGGPLGKVDDGDWIRVEIDCRKMEGSLHWLGGPDRRYALNELDAATQELNQRPTRSSIKPHPKLPDDTRLWAALQKVSGGAWGGSVYDVDAIIQALNRE